ncbi:hypothetical protein SUGI_1034220 [Cryptomeria japonica]|nr:hypothetical protein SUGI_1034220 [Cryptomeria japonica]
MLLQNSSALNPKLSPLGCISWKRFTDVYYEEILKANPGNPLLLRNYAKFLHEVKGDISKAEEFYESAIMAGPKDGEVLSLYAQLIWETLEDVDRTQAYFEQAVQAANQLPTSF